MPTEDFQQPQDGAILLSGQNLGVKIGFARFAQINIHSPVDQSLGGLIKAKFRRLIQQHLSGLQKSNQLIADANWHGGIGETGKTGDGARTIADFLCQLALHFQAAAQIRFDRAINSQKGFSLAAPRIAGCQCSTGRKAIGIPVVSEKARA